MDTGKPIFFGLALIALAIFATDALRPANAGLMGGGRYMMSSANVKFAFIIDTETGALRRCISTYGHVPECSKWSNPKHSSS